MLKWLLISTDWLLPFPGTTSERQSHSTHDKQLELTCFLRGGGKGGVCSTGFTTVWLLFQRPRITINQPLLLGLNDRTLQKPAAGTLPEQRRVRPNWFWHSDPHCLSHSQLRKIATQVWIKTCWLSQEILIERHTWWKGLFFYVIYIVLSRKVKKCLIMGVIIDVRYKII